VVHVRNIEERRRPYLYRYLFRRATAYICISQAVVRQLLEKRLLSDKEVGCVQIIPDGRDISLYEHGDRKRIRREFGINDRTPFVGMIARIEPLKGHDIFLEMAALVAREIPAVRFLVVGDLIGDMHREYMQRLTDLQTTLGLDERLKFAGYREDIPDILAALDCFVHPSHHGAFVSVLIEAMAAGIPIVASDVDGIPECVGRDGAAELVHPIQPALFARAVVRVLKDPESAHMMGQTGRGRAKKYFDAAPLALQTEDVLKAALEATV
jgi:glycosyltransferase involved in cell wall biosynthesis